MNVDFKYCNKFYNNKELEEFNFKALESHKTLINKNGLGNDFLGWLDLPNDYDKEEFENIKKAASKIQNDSDVLLVIGIGGSYLGARSAIDMLSGYFNNAKTKIIFVGNHISSSYVYELKEYLKGKKFSINVISKSGTTTEPAIAFRIFKELLEQTHADHIERIYCTTDKEKGALKHLADMSNYKTFIIPDNVGGRFSVLTAVGLLPICAAGFDIDKMMIGAKDAYNKFSQNSLDNEAILYASMRNLLYKKGKKTEYLVNYEPSLSSFCEWFKQLFGESEGKGNKGLFVSSANFTTDLHSLGQIIQDGERTIFETVLNVVNEKEEVVLNEINSDLDGLMYLENKSLQYINNNAMMGTIAAHVSGGVPNILINVDKLDEYNYGYLVYFFMVSVSVSAYMLGVNPFDQPGVEAYKKNMFALLGKKGYEDLKEEIVNLINN